MLYYTVKFKFTKGVLFMDAINKLGDMVLNECDMTGIYDLSECLTSVFRSIFDLYSTVACNGRHRLFTIRYDFCRLSVLIINVNKSKCRFEIEYNDNMSATKLEKITLDDSNCGLDIIRKNILGCLRSFGIENSVANSLAYMIKNPPRLKANEIYTENYDNLYKSKVASDLLDGVCQADDYFISYKK